MEQIDLEALVYSLILATKNLAAAGAVCTDAEYEQAEKLFEEKKKALLDAIEQHCHNIASAD